MTANRVQPWLDDGDLRLYHGDALTVLQALPAGIAQTCVTSPPYWGLRDYGTGQWSGGDETCDHAPRSSGGPSMLQGASQRGRSDVGSCRCGAQRVDNQLGLEATPTLYVENMVALFREVRRVLRDDGTLWLNLGDSYVATQGGRQHAIGELPKGGRAGKPSFGLPKDREDVDVGGWSDRNVQGKTVPPASSGLKPKDLVGIPWRVAFALQADGWYLRSDIIWSKPNPMPESVSDRPTKAHEYLFLFSKQPRYYMDMDAIREPAGENTHARVRKDGTTDGVTAKTRMSTPGEGVKNNESFVRATASEVLTARNRRSVWTIPTQPFPEAHFATYPEELVRPCILAGTSERGECVECGAPWHREVERERLLNGRAISGSWATRDGYNRGEPGIGEGHGAEVRSTTTGWAPSCFCEDKPWDELSVRPQLVLDPFIGSGTTALVARKHGRRSIGIDLSTEYLAIAAKRTQQLSLLGGAA